MNMYHGELSQSIKVLLIMLTGFGVMLGIVRVASVPLILARILILPLFLGILWNVGRQWWNLLPPGERALVFLVLFPVGMIALMRLILGKDLFRHVLGNFIYDVLKWSFFQFWRIVGLVVNFPIWLIRRLLGR
jgi:hypothetical protein